MANHQCIICDSQDPQYCTVDASTGFSFCGNCWPVIANTQPTLTLSAWLRIIADARDAYRQEHVGELKMKTWAAFEDETENGCNIVEASSDPAKPSVNVVCRVFGNKNSEAARLIAAAPKLLDVCKALVRWAETTTDGEWGEPEETRQAKAVIAEVQK